ncbi:hypothetical protein LPTSP3_g13950 [Leptospira kobayashii]|uniref:Uncharacterized protein n=1 Tax=Leptospira kobayashii TaxID=1917830 RepID=A0ABM7UIA9_9LEPT|nr:hypothetical protein [Leptospira kobayashii]BDA78465.1 hypothetical protein LPTSP3_g13950 [Leptospira kobayashii]
MKKRIKELTHRILKKLKYFREEILNSHVKLSEDEELLGIYLNFNDSEDQSVLFTDKGIYNILLEKGNEFFRYEEIAKLEVIEEKNKAESIRITRKNGSNGIISIFGGEGKLREVWEVYRFLIRVTEIN